MDATALSPSVAPGPERRARFEPPPTRPWLKYYPEGVPSEIDPNKYSSLVDLLDRCADRYADRPAFSNMGVTLSYRTLADKSRAFAAFLQYQWHVSQGDRIAIMMPNLLQYPVAAFGALRAGLTVVNTNPLYTGRELQYQLVDSGASVIVILENYAHVLAQVLAHTPIKHVIVTKIGDMLPQPRAMIVNSVVAHVKRLVPPFNISHAVGFRDAIKRGARWHPHAVALGHDDIAMLQYTGGTTGGSKGAMLSHGNIVANVLQGAAWHGAVIGDQGEIVITALPLYHLFAFTVNCLSFMELGGLNHLITDPRNLKGFVAELRKLRFSCMTGVNTLFTYLMNTPGFADLDFSTLKLTMGGGMAVQRPVAERWQALTGQPILEGYGLTECSPLVCANPLDAREYSGYAGIPVPSTECSIRDEEGRAVAHGTSGELWIRGPQVMKGYWHRPEETAKVLGPDGWLRTGDIAQMDERGYIKLVDRIKDMISVSGFKVYPNEVEEVVASHPSVLEAAVIGVPDPDTGEAVKLFVVPRPGSTIDPEELREHCKGQLAAYKVPRQVVLRTALPKSNVGKVLRRALRDE
jgi:long-chain acyl-CoA synthetase